jgi:O-antigen/teichoic acid export membrane protein
LMLNHLLATIFWRIDIWILRPLAGAASVGLYSVGLKYLDGLNIIPSVFTMAVFPLMSRYAQREGDALLRAYILCLRLLVIASLPIAMAITALAGPLVWLVGGGQFLNIQESYTLFGRTFVINGGSDLALQVVIWSIPFGFVNSVTQYVLIAVHQQRHLTRAFIMGVTFNITGNLLLIPTLGYVGAALVTILSEISLLVPFYLIVRRTVGPVPWLNIFAAPILSVATMGAAIYLLTGWGIALPLAVMAGAMVYLLALLLTGALRGEEMGWLLAKLPLPLRWKPSRVA